ncbi:MAG: hypothetical protein AAEJ65_03805 [Planctomycetota bacterium]
MSLFCVLEEEKAGCLNFLPEAGIAARRSGSSPPKLLPSLAGDREIVV